MPKRTSINDVKEIEDLNDLERIVKDKRNDKGLIADLFSQRIQLELLFSTGAVVSLLKRSAIMPLLVVVFCSILAKVVKKGKCNKKSTIPPYHRLATVVLSTL